MHRFINQRILDRLLLLASMFLGLAHAWIGRYAMNPDGVSYLDVGDALIRRDWAHAVNSYWSPFYGWVLGLVVSEIQPAPKWEFPLVHVVNFAIFLIALLAFRFLLNSVLKFCYQQRSQAGVDGPEPLPDWAIVLLGYALFLWASLELETLYDVSPDLAVLACVCLAGGLLLRLWLAPNFKRFVLFGFVLGVGYWVKAPLFLLGFVILAFGGLWHVRAQSWRRGILAATLIFLCTSAPLVLLLSREKGRLTFGDSAKLNYAWSVSPRTFWRNWQGEITGSGTPLHPTRQLLQHPPLFEFNGPVPGTYPPWDDPSYWNEGLHWHVEMRSQIEVFVSNLLSEIRLLVRAQPGLVAGFLILFLLGGRLTSAGIRELWPLIAVSAAGFALYLPVHVEDRFLGGFVVLLFLTLLAAVRLRLADQRSASYVVIAVFITMASGTADLTVRYATHHLAIPGSGPNSTLQGVVAAEQLLQMGSHPADKVAVIGDGTGAYWARLGKFQIVSEIMDANHGSWEFWESSLATKQKVYGAFESAGAVLAVAVCPSNIPDGWQPIAGTNYCVIQMRPLGPDNSR